MTWDERMTTCAAEDFVDRRRCRAPKAEGIVDQIAAAILLQKLPCERNHRPARAGPEPTEDDDPWSLTNHRSRMQKRLIAGLVRRR